MRRRPCRRRHFDSGLRRHRSERRGARGSVTACRIGCARWSPVCSPTTSLADRCASGCTSSAPVCRTSPGNSPPASTVAARPPTAAASGSPVRPPAPTCIVAARPADAIVVGTGTVFVDDPKLTARLPDGSLADRQPLRVVVGEREISSDANVLNDDSRTMVIRTRDPHEVIKALSDRTDVLIEGGPTLAGAFLRAGVIDRILAYVAPILLGRPDNRDRRCRRAVHRARATVALRRHRADRARRAAQSGSAVAGSSPMSSGRCWIRSRIPPAPSRSRNVATV